LGITNPTVLLKKKKKSKNIYINYKSTR